MNGLKIRLFFFWMISCSYTLHAQIIFEPVTDVPVTVQGQVLQAPWGGGLNAGQYGKADLNGDNKEEVIVYDRSGDVFLIYEREGNDLVLNPYLRYLLPDVDHGWVLFVDYNNDGKKDLFTNGSRGIVVYKNVSEEGAMVSWQKVADPLTTTGFSGKINLIANAADVPGISDVDSDGDYDILVYNFAIGGYIRYNKNLSMELYGRPDSLEYEIKTRSWGEFEECDCNVFTFGGETCADLSGGRVMHPGGKAILAFDNDGDGDKDVLVGHEQCEELYFYENLGDTDSAYMLDYSNTFPEAANPASFNVFPAGFYEDLDFDGVKDLIVTPNLEENLEFKTNFRQSNWFYTNTGADDSPVFSFVKKDLLQEHMIDMGEYSLPVFLDYDNDGDFDLFVAYNGIWNGDVYSGGLSYFRNTGTATSPAFELVDEDLSGLSALKLINPKITLTDYDGDGKKDLLFSGLGSDYFTHECWIFFNQSASGYQYSFDDKELIELPVTMSDTPLFYDIDGDGHEDLLVGKKNGALEYYRRINNGFELMTDSYLGIERDFSLERINLSASVCDLEGDGDVDLITSDYRGIIQIYFDFLLYDPQEQIPFTADMENPVSQLQENIRSDMYAWITAADLFGDGSQSIIFGGLRGGLQLFRYDGFGGSSPEDENKINVEIYPNPLGSQNILTIKSDQNLETDIISTLGQVVRQPFLIRKFVPLGLDLSHLSNGSYIIRFRNKKGAGTTRKLVILK